MTQQQSCYDLHLVRPPPIEEESWPVFVYNVERPLHSTHQCY